MGNLWHDLRYGARMLFKNKGFAAVAIIALALGIGANTAIFSVVNAVLLRPLPFKNAEQLVALRQTSTQRKDDLDFASYPNFTDWRTQTKAFEQLAVFRNTNRTLTGVDQPARLESAVVSANLFQLLGVAPSLGRAFLPEEDQPGRSSYAAILSNGLWQRRFGSDPNILGRHLALSGKNYTVVGVMPDGFQFPIQAEPIELWVPVAVDAETPDGSTPNTAQRGAGLYQVIGRLKPNTTLEQAGAEMDLIARNLEAQYPDTNTHQGVKITPQLELLVGKIRTALLVLFGAVGFVMLISCANVANLLLARATTRHKEMAIRAALGASRWRVVRQLLTESVLLGFAGGALGLLLSVWSVDALRAGMPANFAKFVSGWSNLGIDWRVFGFTMLLSLVTGVIFGLVPALQASKTNLNEALKEGGRSGAQSGRGRNRTRSLLVVTEVALSLVLLVGAGLMMRSFVKLINVDPGFNARNALTFGVALPRAKYPKDAERVNFQKRFLERLETLPGLTNVAAINTIPLGFDNSDTGFWRDGEPTPAPGQTPLAYIQAGSLNYFKTMEIPLLEGRIFDTRDTADATPVLIISRALAQKHFKGEDPLGKRLRLGSGDKPYEIIGVVGDVRHEAFSEKITEQELAVYQPYAQNPWREMTFIVRAKNDPASLTTAVRSELQAIDKDQPLYNVRTMDQVFSESMAPQRLSSFMFAAFALVALLLTAVGIYAVIAYSVAQRTHEIGIRMALGAQRGDIFRLVIGHGMKLILIGIGAGLVAAFAVTRAMASILYNVSTTDVWTFAGISALLAGVALVACYVPAQRATKVDPMIALRHD